MRSFWDIVFAFGISLRSFGDLFGGILGSVWNQFGEMLKSILDHVGINLHQFGIMLESLWHHFGVNFESFRNQIGIILGSIWNPFGIMLNLFPGPCYLGLQRRAHHIASDGNILKWQTESGNLAILRSLDTPS